jgi:hypothetical protein
MKIYKNSDMKEQEEEVNSDMEEQEIKVISINLKDFYAQCLKDRQNKCIDRLAFKEVTFKDISDLGELVKKARTRNELLKLRDKCQMMIFDNENQKEILVKHSSNIIDNGVTLYYGEIYEDVKIKLIELGKLIEFKMETMETIGEDLPTFKTNYTPNQLKELHKRLYQGGYIERIDEKEFLYLFEGKPIIEKMKPLKWNKSLPMAHTFLSIIVYCGSQFNFNQVNSCMKFNKDAILDSNNKIKNTDGIPNYKADNLKSILTGL